MEGSQLTYPALRTLPKMIAFLEEKLSTEEMDQVEQIIEEDELYAFALERLHQAMLKGENIEETAAQFQDVFITQIRKEAKPEAKTISFPNWAKWAVAATIVLIIIIFIPRSNQVIDDRIYTPYEPRFSLKGDGSEIKLETFQANYLNKNYDQAILIGNELLTDSTSFSPLIESEIQICLGYSYLETNNIDPAIRFFNQALTSSEARIRVEARWYLALTFIKAGENKNAIPYLEAITSPEAGKSRIEAAKKVLEMIR